MQAANSRSTLVPPTSKQPPKWSRGMSFSLDLSESKAPKVSDQKLSIKSSSLAQDEKMNLEKELQKSKESERTMLESLISQTKQFEQAKISLEEAKLEIRSLQESIKSRQRSTKNLEKSQSERKQPRDEEIGMVQKELQLAAEAEEKSKKAMDGLALALKEVSTEANRVKARLSTRETELEKAEEESMQLKLNIEDLIATITEKEKGFHHCMKMSEEENDRLTNSLRISREDNAKLRDIMKHAVNEATVVKEALEIVRNENAQLQDLLSEKEIGIRQDYECLKVSERAASDRSVEEYSIEPKEPKRMVKLPSEKWEGEGRKLPPKRMMELGGESLASEKQKKKTMFKRFGDILSKSSFHK